MLTIRQTVALNLGTYATNGLGGLGKGTACLSENASLNVQSLGFASALALLSRFKQLMAHDGTSVDTQRMLARSDYALEQLALGHTSTSEPLRQCAVRVFALFHA